ncbi:aryl-sulfate sulfotransferase [Aerococcaceae bacterium DSM 111176]|nr:aryl-sulfate sulfotransferase [Aerococcaceae bacterium DSM 111176]
MKKLLKLLLTLTLFSICFFSSFSNTYANVPDHAFTVTQYEDTSLPMYDFVFDMEKEGQDAQYYNVALQETLNGQVEQLQHEGDYGFEDPLAIMNPYGTNTTALYMYFNEADISDITYTIDTPVYGSNYTFSRTIKNNNANENIFEFQIIGLVPNVENTVTLRALDDSGNEVKSLNFTITPPKSNANFPNMIQKDEGTSTQELAPGLFVLIGNSVYPGYGYIVDNDGVLRGEIQTEGYRLDRIVTTEDYMIYPSNSNEIAFVNPLGQVIQVIHLTDLNMHHDFILAEENELWILASINDAAIPRREDLILKANIQTGEVETMIDLMDLFPELYINARPTLTSSGNPDLDWIHLNSITKFDDDSIIVSARETSSIIKFSNIHEDPQVDYIIGPDEPWVDTESIEYLYQPEGDFPLHAGQHSALIEHDDALDDGQYYIEFFNNNYWDMFSRPDLTAIPINDQVYGFNDESPHAESYYYKYLVDENAGTFSLADSYSTPYSAIVGNVSPQENSKVINTGRGASFGEYDLDGELIAQFQHVTTNYVYRVQKLTFNNFWFE